MFTSKHYVPILKAKEGEFGALKETFPPSKELMTPLLEIVAIAWDYEDDQEAKTIDQHLAKVGAKILDSLGVERRFFVDSNLIDGNRVMLDNATHHIVYLFNDFRAKQLTAIPTTGLRRLEQYRAAVKTILDADGRGMCLRLDNVDLTALALKARIDTELTFFGITPAETDLIIDLGSINEDVVNLLVFSMAGFINNALPYVNDWRTLTIAASGFPPDLSDITPASIDSIQRAEWAMWTGLLSTVLKRHPSFGDYSIAHPDMAELDPRTMRVSASIRYTSNDYWLILRGQWLQRHGYGQFRNLANALIRRTEYSDPTYSWGDHYINECAAGRVGTGSLTTWRKIANNHHFQKVIEQISSLP